MGSSAADPKQPPICTAPCLTSTPRYGLLSRSSFSHAQTLSACSASSPLCYYYYDYYYDYYYYYYYFYYDYYYYYYYYYDYYHYYFYYYFYYYYYYFYYYFYYYYYY